MNEDNSQNYGNIRSCVRIYGNRIYGFRLNHHTLSAYGNRGSNSLCGTIRRRKRSVGEVKMGEKKWIYDSDKERLTKWIRGRDVCEADVIEYLVDHFLKELEYEFPRVVYSEEGIREDLRYERKQDERMGF